MQTCVFSMDEELGYCRSDATSAQHRLCSSRRLDVDSSAPTGVQSFQDQQGCEYTSHDYRDWCCWVSLMFDWIYVTPF